MTTEISFCAQLFGEQSSFFWMNGWGLL